MNTVSDTNEFLMRISPKTKLNVILLPLITGKLELLLTHVIKMEYEEVFESHPGNSGTKYMIDVVFSLPKVTIININYRRNLTNSDADDNKFVDCAIAANANFIITEDKHFDVLHSIDFPVITPIGEMDFINQYLK